MAVFEISRRYCHPPRVVHAFGHPGRPGYAWSSSAGVSAPMYQLGDDQSVSPLGEPAGTA
jgi:hypothetical protein